MFLRRWMMAATWGAFAPFAFWPLCLSVGVG